MLLLVKMHLCCYMYMATFDLMATDESTDVNSGAADGNRLPPPPPLGCCLGSSDDMAVCKQWMSTSISHLLSQSTNQLFSQITNSFNFNHSSIHPLWNMKWLNARPVSDCNTCIFLNWQQGELIHIHWVNDALIWAAYIGVFDSLCALFPDSLSRS